MNVDNALGVLVRFASVPGSIFKARTDLEPVFLDLKINATDVLSSLSGFWGVGYPFTATAVNSCDSTCLHPLPR